ncbi:hypothetical protein RJ55_08534 [Drechmeria coniospora]|nr:hypothetical protein RJ55_08534 [Drechmeria coniospora]
MSISGAMHGRLANFFIFFTALCILWPNSVTARRHKLKPEPSSDDAKVDVVWRGDTRTPDQVKQAGGLFPHNYRPSAPIDRMLPSPRWNFNLDSHLSGGADSPFVSTTSEFFVAGQFAMGWQGGGEAYIYQIKTTPNMYPANSFGSKIFPEQSEYVALGGVGWKQIQGWYVIDRVAEREDGRFAFQDRNTKPDPGRDRFYANDDYRQDIFGKQSHVRPKDLTPVALCELEQLLGSRKGGRADCVGKGDGNGDGDRSKPSETVTGKPQKTADPEKGKEGRENESPNPTRLREKPESKTAGASNWIANKFGSRPKSEVMISPENYLCRTHEHDGLISPAITPPLGFSEIKDS